MKNLSMSSIMMLVAAVIVSFFLGRYSVNMNSSASADSTPKDEVVMTGKGGDVTDNEGTAVVNEDEEAKKLEEEKKLAEAKKLEEEEKKKEERKEEPVATIDAPSTIATGANLPRTNMGISDRKIGEVLTSIADNLEAKKLVYSSELLQDCSGIYHQMKDSLQSRLPALAESGGEYQYPSSTSVRNTRQIADWFYKNDNLLIVQDAMASRNSIRPGSVMFYGKSNKTFKNITIDMLTDRKNNYTRNAAIMHIAVVTAVTTDADGNVVDYTIMHGRNSRNPASRTGSKAVQSTRTPNLPPFGNWSQQLVAIANIATPK